MKKSTINLLSSLNRPHLIRKLTNEEFDLLIIGGGITGAGICLDATWRGIRTLLIEKGDFASGTSSKSSKLIHGGLRYLKQGDIGLVMEVGRERAVLHQNAPHLVIPEKMLLPIVRGGAYGIVASALGLTFYDFLASIRRDERKKMLNFAQTLEQEPLLNSKILKGGFLFSEYRTNDARLTLEIIKTACEKGAVAANYIMMDQFLYEGDKIKGVVCRDQLDGRKYTLHTKKVVNAAGPWVDNIREADGPLEGKTLHHTKGIHIVVPHEKLPVKQSVYFDDFDGRMIFAIPHGNTTYIGTTDTDYTGDLTNPCASLKDVIYLVKAANTMFPTSPINQTDVISSWAGIRPLIHQEGKPPSQISRKDEIFESTTGLLSIAGGKLTGYRKMAEKVVNAVNHCLNKDYNMSYVSCQTADVVINGGAIGDIHAFKRDLLSRVTKLGLGAIEVSYLTHAYGIQALQIIENCNSITENDTEIRLAKAELQFCLEHESVHHLTDFFICRTGRMYFEPWSVPKLMDPLATDAAARLGWDNSRIIEEKQEVERILNASVNFV